MIKWLPKIDKNDKRQKTSGSGRIEHGSSIYVPQKLYDKITCMLPSVREAFDELVISFSMRFKWWKGRERKACFIFIHKVNDYTDKGKSHTLQLLWLYPNEDSVQVLSHPYLNSGVEGDFSDGYTFGKQHRDFISDLESARKMVDSKQLPPKVGRKDKKSDKINPQDGRFYLQMREDFEKALRKCQSEAKRRISMDEMLDILENDLTEAGHQLEENWRSITEENIEIWSKESGLKLKVNYDKERREIILEWPDQNIYDYFENRDFFFPKEILTRYFLSLKTDGSVKSRKLPILANLPLIKSIC